MPFDTLLSMLGGAEGGSFPGMGAALNAIKAPVPRVQANPMASRMNLSLLRHGMFEQPQPRTARLGPQGGGMPSEGFGGVFADPSQQAGANALLGEYGLHLPDHPSQFALFSDNGGWASRHAGLAKALEGAFFGGANTAPSQNTGEAITNVLRGVIGGHQQRNAMLQQQYEAPFRAAEAMLPLKKEAEEQRYRDAQIQQMKDLTEYRHESMDLRSQMETERMSHAAEILGFQQDKQAQKEQLDIMKLGGPDMNQALFALGVDPAKATPAQKQAAAKALWAHQENLRTISASANRASGEVDKIRVEGHETYMKDRIDIGKTYNSRQYRQFGMPADIIEKGTPEQKQQWLLKKQQEQDQLFGSWYQNPGGVAWGKYSAEHGPAKQADVDEFFKNQAKPKKTSQNIPPIPGLTAPPIVG